MILKLNSNVRRNNSLCAATMAKPSSLGTRVSRLGRDSLICARGLLAAGMKDEVKQLLLTFAKFEKDGTLPNTIHGNDVSNRDTSDAPLWFAVVCDDLADKKFFDTQVDSTRTIRDVLASIAETIPKEHRTASAWMLTPR